MRTTMDEAGRIVVPVALRERLGLVPGPIEIVPDGSGLRIDAVAQGVTVERDGRLVVVGDGPALSDEDIRELRLADQR